ncbi:HTH domain-containing protein [Butyrivibrio sp. AE3006]|uniref:HTH domain-containing protein n=1 Tax=Butyrivibrio sp. AE3006 TaxID=1280673 RepID=UPI0004198D31|nr:HTH domain-containing protein [Butyrivibrio sp. AE3006]
MRERHHINQFTPEQIELLAANPFTLSVTAYRISYTLEFKNLFLSHYENGELVRDIFRELGYAPGILGDSRMYSFSHKLLSDVEAGKPITEGSVRKPAEKPVKTDYNTMPAQQSVASMQRELTYLRQQVEFLKKISQLDTTKKSEP